ncbi:MAG: TonB-dependent receptor [Planctomycetota bacterium]|nr:TonB-dependent receptor [Planctomycetota bacterium]MDA1140049.1 TonB-dependent receptor [Planctomycetota bacterium]
MYFSNQAGTFHLLGITIGITLLSDWTLIAEVAILPPVVVVANRDETETMKVPGNVTVITAENIGASSARNISELLKSQVGLHVTNTSGTSPTGVIVEARGFNNGGGNGGRTLVLVDGHRANQADTSSADWALIPLRNIERIEILRGPVSALYGDSAMASVIQIFTKRGTGEPSISFDFDAGSFGFWEQSGAIQGEFDGLRFFITSMHSAQDGYRQNSDFEFTHTSMQLNQRVSPELFLDFKALIHSDERRFPGTLTRDEIAQVSRRGTVTNDDERDDQQWQVAFGVTYSPTESSTFDLGLNYNDDQALSNTSFPGQGTTGLADNADDKSFTVKHTWRGEFLGRETRFVSGLDFLQEDVETESFNNFPNPPFPFIQQQVSKFKRKFFALYLQNDTHLLENLILSAGLRLDQADFIAARTTTNQIFNTITQANNDKDFGRLSPKAAITWLPMEDLSTYFSYSQSYRFPNRDELTGLFGLTPELLPEKGENFEVGVKTQTEWIGGGVSLYHLTVRDEILFQPPAVGAFGFGQNINFEEILHRGVEVNFFSDIIPRTRMFAGYTYVDTEIEKGPFEGSELPITPRHAGNVGANLDIGFGFHLWTEARFTGQRFIGNDLGNQLAELAGYGVWNAKLSYAYESGAWKLGLFIALNNILDKEYEEFAGAGGQPHGSRIGFNPSPEFYFSAGVGVSRRF